ncbi:putative short-chain dehydrogenase/reductase [Hypoxylon cercidicola]|nr:putative short-chain dehydrogenase/reductase [Hypoxylon cercidicola]
MSLSKKTALITGCSDGGLGAAMAKVLHEKGYHVFATLRNTSKAGALRGMSDVEILELDVSSKESIARCAAEVRHRTSTLDMLINNAGNDFIMPILDTDIEKAKKYFDVNFWSVPLVTQAFADPICKARGVIVNASSVLWNIPTPWAGVYTTSKAAVKQLSETMRIEMEPLGVRVVTAIIGAVGTNFFSNALNEPFELPENSYYRPIAKLLEDQRGGTRVPPREHVDVTARNIVNDVLGGASGCIWRGARSTDAKWLTWLLPTWALEWMVNGARGLEELRQHYLPGKTATPT